MSQEIITASLVQRYDTSENWSNSSLRSRKGEIAIVENPGGELTVKIGNGDPWKDVPTRPLGTLSSIVLDGQEFKIVGSTATLDNLIATKAKDLVDPEKIAVGFAICANRLISGSAETPVDITTGSSNVPVYFEGGVPKECTPYKDAVVNTATKLSSNGATISVYTPTGSVSVNVDSLLTGSVLSMEPYDISFFRSKMTGSQLIVGETIHLRCGNLTESALRQVKNLSIDSENSIELVPNCNSSGSIRSGVTVTSTGLYPHVGKQLDLGSVGQRWKDCYVTNVYADGDVVAANTSDRRLKDNIESIDLKEADRVLKALKPVSFDWNVEEERLTGGRRHGKARSFIADEFLEVLPNAGQKVYDGKYDAIYIEQVIPYLVAGYQKQQQEIEDLKKELAELRSKK